MALKVVIAGASGKMGRSLIEAVAAEGMVLHAALDASGSCLLYTSPSPREHGDRRQCHLQAGRDGSENSW